MGANSYGRVSTFPFIPREKSAARIVAEMNGLSIYDEGRQHVRIATEFREFSERQYLSIASTLRINDQVLVLAVKFDPLLNLPTAEYSMVYHDGRVEHFADPLDYYRRVCQPGHTLQKLYAATHANPVRVRRTKQTS